jgi:hypothetical protein
MGGWRRQNQVDAMADDVAIELKRRQRFGRSLLFSAGPPAMTAGGPA